MLVGYSGDCLPPWDSCYVLLFLIFNNTLSVSLSHLLRKLGSNILGEPCKEHEKEGGKDDVHHRQIVDGQPNTNR